METYGYLYAYFTWAGAGRDDQRVFMATSRDGLHFAPLNKGDAILTSTVGTKAVRDPHIFRNIINGKYYVIATDLNMNLRDEYFNEDGEIDMEALASTDQAQMWKNFLNSGSKSIVVWDSEDLVHWSDGKLVQVSDGSIANVWAPKVCYDPIQKDYVMAFSGAPSGTANLEVHYARTKDFYSFSKPETLIPAFPNVAGEKVFEDEVPREYVQFIDSTTIHVDDWYYRFTKRETRCVIQCERSRNITTGFEMLTPVVAEEHGVEGPCCYPIEDGAHYVLLMDGFILDNENVGYFPSIATKEELSQGIFHRLSPAEYSLPEGCKHGSVMPLTKEEYERLMK